METKSKLTVSRILKIICSVLLLTFFIPSCLVSCSGVEIKISGYNAMTGITVNTGYGTEKITEFNFGAMLMLLIPAFLLFILFTNKALQEKVKAIICMALYGVDVALWVGFASEIIKNVEKEGENLFNIDFTGWYWLNLALPIIGAILSLLIIVKVLHFETAFGQGLTIENPVDKSVKSAELNETATTGTDAPATENNTTPVQKVDIAPFIEKAKSVLTQLLDKIKVLPKKTLMLIGGGALVLIILLVAINSAGKTIDLNKYIVVNTEGYNGYGSAYVYLDKEQLLNDNLNKIKLTSDGNRVARKQGYELTSKESVENFIEDLFIYDINIKSDKTSQLSNGDTVAYTITVDKEIEDYLKNKIKFKDGEISISDLEEVKKVDFFEGVELKCEGLSGSGYCHVEGDDRYVIDINSDNSNSFKNGDDVELIIKDSQIERYAKKEGIVPAESSKMYTISGLKERLVSVEQIIDTERERLDEVAKDYLYDYINGNWSKTETSLLDIEPYGELIYSKSNKPTKLYFVYKITANNTYEKEDFNEDISYFWYYLFDNASIDDSGLISYENAYYKTPSNRVVHSVPDSWHSWYYYGYEDIDSLLKNVKLEGYELSDNIE